MATVQGKALEVVHMVAEEPLKVCRTELLS